MAEKPIVICLTPVKNEAWIIERFLQCASLWADYIILADQNSTDATLEIASRFPKVIIINNPSPSFNEVLGRSLLIQEARKIKGRRILVALDADECFTSEILDENFWIESNRLEKGTTVCFKRINIHPNLSFSWHEGAFHRLFIDDDHTSFSPNKLIHMRVLPVPEKAVEVFNEEVKIIHYQYTDWERMKSKHRWYQAWETLNFPEKDPVGLYRMYHHMYAVPKSELLPLDKGWFKGYEDAGIDMFTVKKEDSYYWDEQATGYFKELGTHRFSKIAIWGKQWKGYDDPRSILEKLVHLYLEKTQKTSRMLLIRLMDKVLKLVFR